MEYRIGTPQSNVHKAFQKLSAKGVEYSRQGLEIKWMAQSRTKRSPV